MVQYVEEDGKTKLVLVDGGHRLSAYQAYNEQAKKDGHEEIKEVPIKYWKTEEAVPIDEYLDEMEIYGHGLNDEQGTHSRSKDTRKVARDLKIRHPEWKGLEIGKKLNRAERTINDYVEDIAREQRASEKQLMINLSLMGWGPQEIADHGGITVNRPRVSQIINDVKNSGISEINGFYDQGKRIEDIAKMFDISTHATWNVILEQKTDLERFELFGTGENQNENPRYDTLWNFKQRDKRLGIEHPGNIPGQLIMNLLYYYTQPGDLIVDPMAGGGSTIDACLIMGRKCRAYDIDPVRKEVEYNDIKNGLPLKNDSVDFIFYDPPYGDWKKEEYTGEISDMSQMSYEEFIDTVGLIGKESKRVLKPRGKIGFLIMDISRKEYLDLPFECYKQLNESLKPLQRIHVPSSGFSGQDQLWQYRAMKNKFMLRGCRDLLIMEKEE